MPTFKSQNGRSFVSGFWRSDFFLLFWLYRNLKIVKNSVSFRRGISHLLNDALGCAGIRMGKKMDFYTGGRGMQSVQLSASGIWVTLIFGVILYLFTFAFRMVLFDSTD